MRESEGKDEGSGKFTGVIVTVGGSNDYGVVNDKFKVKFLCLRVRFWVKSFKYCI
jgi:hypothetical protein